MAFKFNLHIDPCCGSWSMMTGKLINLKYILNIIDLFIKSSHVKIEKTEIIFRLKFFFIPFKYS